MLKKIESNPNIFTEAVPKGSHEDNWRKENSHETRNRSLPVPTISPTGDPPTVAPTTAAPSIVPSRPPTCIPTKIAKIIQTNLPTRTSNLSPVPPPAEISGEPNNSSQTSFYNISIRPSIYIPTPSKTSPPFFSSPPEASTSPTSTPSHSESLHPAMSSEFEIPYGSSWSYAPSTSSISPTIV